MTDIEYSYTILKYRHDAAAGEVLNVGVVLFSPSTGQVGLQFDPRYGRLSQTFAHFDGELYKRVLERLSVAVNSLATPMRGNLFELDARSKFEDAGGLVRAAWPDQGLSYFSGPVCFGVTNDLGLELKNLFDLFVLSQFDRRDSTERFNDEQLWDTFKRVLSPRGILNILKPVTLGPAEVEFEHAYKNERWHVFEPLSLDYVDGAGMKKRAYELAGKAASVRELDDMGTFTILLGRPKRVDADRQFLSARRILADAPGSVKIVEESEAESFASDLQREMREHGVLN